MKTLTAFRRKVLILMAAFGLMGSALKQNALMAQLPDCTGTFMYGIWNDSIRSTNNVPSEIRSINFTTGAVGGLVGGTTILISKSGSGGPYYGSAGLGLDPIFKNFFVMTQMSSAIQKDIIAINPLTGGTTVIATTPTLTNANVPDLLTNYHFVKLAISPGGIGYAIGVQRDTVTSFNSAKCNPLISFTTCGATVLAGCSTIKLLGYLSNSVVQTKNWNLFNGDIAFDNAGNLYFLTVGFHDVNGNGRYCDARLLRIAAANIPLVPGTGSIPLSVVADYNGLDSTVVNGIAFNTLGQLFFSTRLFSGQQGPCPGATCPTFTNNIFRSTTPGTVAPLAGFTNPTAGKSISDLASCNFPLGVLADIKMQLSGWNESGSAKLKWEVNLNNQVMHYELQASDDGSNFETVARVNVTDATSAMATYSYTDNKVGTRNIRYYRVREVLPTGSSYYSNVVKINLGSKLTLLSKPSPNPFFGKFDLRLELKSASPIAIRLRNQGGSLVYQRNISGNTGENRISINGLDGLSRGVYMVEITVDEEIIREKLIKQ